MKRVQNLNWFLIDGNWHHCVWVADETKLRQYVDGVLVLEQDIEDPTEIEKVWIRQGLSNI
jgi:hypothetical protein